MIWAPHTQKDIMALERVQRRFVCNNYSHYSYANVNEMLGCLNWFTFAQGRNKQKLISYDVYKIVHQLVDIQAMQQLATSYQSLHQRPLYEIYPTIYKNRFLLILFLSLLHQSLMFSTPPT